MKFFSASLFLLALASCTSAVPACVCPGSSSMSSATINFAVTATTSISPPTTTPSTPNILTGVPHIGDPSTNGIDLHLFSLQDPVKFGNNISPVGVNDARFTRQTDGSIVMTAVQGDAKTTHGSGPRCDLREIVAWNGNTGSHKMIVTKSILTSTPVTVAQIFNQAIDLPMAFVKYDGTALYVLHNEVPKQKIVIDSAYKTGSVFTLTITMTARHVQITYSNADGSTNSASFIANSADSTLYFKTGAYSQGDVTSSVHMTALAVSHA